MNIVGFAFRENISSNVLEKLKVKKKYFLRSDKKELKKFIEELIAKRPDYILGLGMYSRADKDKLRIETECSENGKRYSINYFLRPGNNTKLANGIGNSYCNFVSAEIMKAIRNKKLNSKYTFVHIPTTFDPNNAVSELEIMFAHIK